MHKHSKFKQTETNKIIVQSMNIVEKRIVIELLKENTRHSNRV